jgi:DNA ligase 1
MKAFAELYTALDETNKTGEKIAALKRYFSAAPAADAAWAVYFLIGRKPRQVVPTRQLRAWAAEAANVPAWLFDESYHAVGDLAETVALILPPPSCSTDEPLHQWVERLLTLRNMPEAAQQEALLAAWRQMNQRQRYVWNKLITGSFRVGVSQALVTRALAEVNGLSPPLIAHRLMGEWSPTPDFYRRLCGVDDGTADVSRPYPFFLAHPLIGSPVRLGAIDQWQIEWKWDGIRAQLIRRADQIFLWSRGEELVTERYPEITSAGERLPDGTVVDGEILAWKGGVLPFGHLQRRIGRKTMGKKLLEDVPVVLLAYDLLELNDEDVREQPLAWRREQLAAMIGELVPETALRLSPVVHAPSWAALDGLWAESRSRRVEGLMLKRLDSPYRVGRVRGDWWKWKISPYTIDAVLIYAQRGSGKRASLYTDYTFGVWDEGRLVPIAKAYSGLTDAEIRKVDAFVRRHTTEKFGPVRTVTPEHVFELAFEGIQRSSRHKCGVAVRFPRILRWRTDKKPEDADSLDRVKAMLADVPAVAN